MLSLTYCNSSGLNRHYALHLSMAQYALYSDHYGVLSDSHSFFNNRWHWGGCSGVALLISPALLSLSNVAFSEGLSKLHSSAPSRRRWAAVCLRHSRLSTSMWLFGRLMLNPFLRYHQAAQIKMQHKNLLTEIWCHAPLKNLADFSLDGRPEDGRGKCSFDPSQSFTTVMVGELRPV